MPDYNITIALTEEEATFLARMCEAYYEEIDSRYQKVCASCQKVLERRLKQLKENQKLTERLPRIEK